MILTFGNNAGTGNFAGTITQAAGATLALVKNGTGTITLSGANSFTGGLTVNSGGTLNIANTFRAPVFRRELPYCQ